MVMSLLGHYNNFFFAAHLLDIAMGVKTLRTILSSVTHNGKQVWRGPGRDLRGDLGVAEGDGQWSRDIGEVGMIAVFMGTRKWGRVIFEEQGKEASWSSGPP